MEPLFSIPGRRRLKKLLSSRCLLAFDFDGVLAPHRATRSGAQVRPATIELLERLQVRFPIAVVTGRSLKDVQKRLGFEPDYVVGNHGVEGLPKFSTASRVAAEASAVWLKRLRRVAKEIPGLLVDDKKFSLTVHFSGTEDPGRTKALLLKLAQEWRPLPRVVIGKKVINFVHPKAPHKGDAVLALMKQFKVQKALYVGDDRTDEDVFCLKDPRILTVRVGKKSDSAAKFYIPNQIQFDRFLRSFFSTPRKA